MEEYTKDNGRMVCSMVKENIKIGMENGYKVYGKKEKALNDNNFNLIIYIKISVINWW